MGENSPLLDLLIIGAGVSGINTAYRVQTELPHIEYAILEARDDLGGTWDLFQFPGIRSDSDMLAFGFSWRMWQGPNSFADGKSLKKYIRESAEAFGIDKKIRYRHRLSSANWSTENQSWSLALETSKGREFLNARFVVFGTGYYDYGEALSPPIKGIENFEGTVLRPQFWSQGFDPTDKRIVVIGSGASAVTLVPKLAETASHVAMLQRSPSYIMSRPQLDPMTGLVRRLYPAWLAAKLNRLRILLLGFIMIKVFKNFPLRARNLLRKATMKNLPDTTPYNPHFEPRYNPWEQRLCVAPDGDFFNALRHGKASIVTDVIETVTKNGISLASQTTLDANALVVATGLRLQILGGAKLSVDGQPVDIGDKYAWRYTMLQDVPNAIVLFGYANMSWTLGADVSAVLLLRLLKHMRKAGIASATPRIEQNQARSMRPLPFLDLTSTYVVERAHVLPKTGDKEPWGPRSTYFQDLWKANFAGITEGLEFSNG